MLSSRTLYAALVTTAVLACSNERAATDSAANQTEGYTVVPQAAPAAPPSPPALREERQARGIVGTGAAGKVAGRSVAAAASVAPAAAEVPVPAGVPGQGAFTQPAAPSMIIRTGVATLEVDSLEVGIALVQQVVQGITGAYVANTSLETGENQVRRASIEIKVPAAHFDRVVAALRPIGKVEGVNVTAEDVTEEFVDVSARVENARRLEARLVDLLAQRTGRLADVLAVERELARVREEIERYEGRMRFLRTRAAVSTLTVVMHEPVPILGERPAGNPLAEALRQSWRNFVGFVAGFIAVLGVLVPVAVLGYVAWLVARRFFRRPAAAIPADRGVPAGGV